MMTKRTIHTLYILKSSLAAGILFLGVSLGSCNDRPQEDGAVIQHPQGHDHVMGEGLGEDELEAADDTLRTIDTVEEQNGRTQEQRNRRQQHENTNQ